MWLFSVLVACGAPTAPPLGSAPAPAPASGGVRTVDVAALHGAGPVPLVDVRTPQEYAAGHVPGAINVPLDQLSPDRLAAVAPADQEIWVICEVGGRSAAASARMAGWGLHPVNVDGGTRAWRAAGWPTE